MINAGIAARRAVVLLVGPKGAGKTYLARRLAREAEIIFVPVEEIWMDLRREGGRDLAAFNAEGQRRVLGAIAEALTTSRAAVIESTGTAPWFHGFLRDIEHLATVLPMRVDAPDECCLARIRARDGAAHLPVPDEQVAMINGLARRVALAWIFEIENTSPEAADRFITAIGTRLRAAD